MSDGRLFTDYGSRCDINYIDDQGQGKSLDSYNYRQYLTKNADAVLYQARKKTYDRVVCGPCEEPYNIGTMMPESALEVCNTRNCARKVLDDGSSVGIGLGRWYGEATPYRSSQTIQSQDPQENHLWETSKLKTQGANCCANNPDDYTAYFPEMNITPGINRNATPYGGVPLSGGDASIKRW
jgi:hypothetical protein